MKKITFHGEITNELGVIMAFSKIHEELGFEKIVCSSPIGFDIGSIQYNGNDVTVEFEHKSSNFLTHGHPSKMEKGRKYVVICWEDDCGLMQKIKKDYKKDIFEVIEIRKYVKIDNENSPVDNKDEEPICGILSYNPKYAGDVDFGNWAFVNCYRVNTSEKSRKFKKNEIPKGSKFLFYRDGFIIGGFTVVRYEIIEEPKTKREMEIYKKLTDYPITHYSLTENEISENYLRGHIFYTDFFDMRDYKKNLSKYKINKQMGRQGYITIDRETYYRILGE
ncbi:MAG TPA: hypothetical protein PLW78_00145 [bacterium]|jgi:septum formation topological specificity factor MinE|nr:hypothetical protein [bacterium]HRQ68683.1 hypothetical protein [bacterium]